MGTVPFGVSGKLTLARRVSRPSAGLIAQASGIESLRHARSPGLTHSPADRRRIVYLHGFASGPRSKKSSTFRETLEPLGWLVDIPDLNPTDFRDLTVGGMLTLSESVIRRSAPEPVALVGSSLGGYLAATLAGYCSQVAALVLLAPAFDLRSRWAQRLGPDALRTWQRLGTIGIYHHGLKAEQPLAYKFYEESEGYPAFPEIGATPTLIFHGRHDDTVPVETAQRFALGRPNVDLRILDDGHELLESAQQIVEEARQFFESHVPRARSQK